jgi:hypothetical protein
MVTYEINTGVQESFWVDKIVRHGLLPRSGFPERGFDGTFRFVSFRFVSRGFADRRARHAGTVARNVLSGASVRIRFSLSSTKPSDELIFEILVTRAARVRPSLDAGGGDFVVAKALESGRD